MQTIMTPHINELSSAQESQKLFAEQFFPALIISIEFYVLPEQCPDFFMITRSIIPPYSPG